MCSRNNVVIQSIVNVMSTNIFIFRAKTEAQAIINRYELEAETFKNISRDLGLTSEGQFPQEVPFGQ